jgi:hypothetical protein
MATVVVHHNDPAGFDVYVGRAGHGEDGYFGNPFRADASKRCVKCRQIHARKTSTLACYENWFQARVQKDAKFRSRLEALRGKRLACFCRPPEGFQGRLLCHAQIIAGYLDGVSPKEVP